jgi:hypothetical protein
LEISSAWETIRDIIELSAKKSLDSYDLKKHMSRFDHRRSELLDQRKQAKLQWLHHPSEINGENLNNMIREANKYFTNKTRAYMKDKVNDLVMNSKNKNGINIADESK